MDRKQLKTLAVAAVKQIPLTFSQNGKEETYNSDAINETLRTELNELTCNYAAFRRNQNLIFELIEETIDEVLPAKVQQQYEAFAETRTLAQGDKAVFTLKVTEAARTRAKQFVTRVGLAGRYEVFMLDGAQLEVTTTAIGGAARIGFEEFLDGRIEFSDLTSILLEGMDEFIYVEIAKALDAAYEEVPTNNKVSTNKFDEKAMDRLLSISDSYYGGNSVIICTNEFAGTMVPSTGSGINYDAFSSGMKEELWRNGRLGDYKGHTVIILRQSMVDANNEEKVIDPSKAYILPAGNTRPVKIAFEGPTHVRTVEDNDDWSRDLQTYKKFGVAVMTNPAMCRYENTSLTTEVNPD